MDQNINNNIQKKLPEQLSEPNTTTTPQLDNNGDNGETPNDEELDEEELDEEDIKEQEQEDKEDRIGLRRKKLLNEKENPLRIPKF